MYNKFLYRVLLGIINKGIRDKMGRRKNSAILGEDAELIRRHMLTAAQTVFLRYGIAKTTMEDIAREAGVSRPTLYRCFRDRDSLTAELVTWHAHQLVDQVREFLSDFETFEDKLVEGLIFGVHHGMRDPIIRILVNPGELDGSSWMTTVPLATSLAAELWGPIFDDAKKDGEMRLDISTDAATEWITLVLLMLAPRLENSPPSDPSHRSMIKQFVLPAFLP